MPICAEGQDRTGDTWFFSLLFGCLSQEHTAAWLRDRGSPGGRPDFSWSLNGCHRLCLYAIPINNGDRNREPAMQILAVQVTLNVDAAHDESERVLA